MGVHYPVYLLDEGRDKAQSKGHHHGECMHLYLEYLEGREHPLKGVGQHGGGRGIGQQRADDNEQDYTHGSKYRGINACGRYGYFPE